MLWRQGYAELSTWDRKIRCVHPNQRDAAMKKKSLLISNSGCEVACRCIPVTGQGTFDTLLRLGYERGVTRKPLQPLTRQLVDIRNTTTTGVDTAHQCSRPPMMRHLRLSRF